MPTGRVVSSFYRKIEDDRWPFSVRLTPEQRAWEPPQITREDSEGCLPFTFALLELLFLSSPF